MNIRMTGLDWRKAPIGLREALLPLAGGLRNVRALRLCGLLLRLLGLEELPRYRGAFLCGLYYLADYLRQLREYPGSRIGGACRQRQRRRQSQDAALRQRLLERAGDGELTVSLAAEKGAKECRSLPVLCVPRAVA